MAIDAFTPTPSGFAVELSAEIRESVLNLYDTESQALGAADVTLTGNATGDVPGSLVVQGTTLTFIATGGALPADTYSVVMRSAADGIVDDALGEALDGEFSGAFPSGDGVTGGDFEFTFSVTANPLVVGIPDFARGPSQSVRVPAAGSGLELPAGLPVQFSDANGVTSFTLTVAYDPALLSITGAAAGPDAPAGSQVQANVTVPGQATIAFFALEPMGSGAVDLVTLTADVPESAPYGTTQVVDLTFIEVNAGALQATADDALHVVAFPGDANANRRYDAEDARLIARTGIGLDSGFVTTTPTGSSTTNLLYPTVDAVIIGDVTGVDGLSPLDASDVLRVAIGLPTANIPAIPDAQAPTNLNLSASTIVEKQPSGTLVGTLTTTDPDLGDTHTYDLVAGTGDTDNASFTISGSTLLTAAEFDHAVQDTFNVRVRTTDSTGRTLEQAFTISVDDINEAPTAVAISNDIVAEDIAIGASVGTLTSTDPDSNNTHSYSLVSGPGDTDNASFVISGDQLQVAASLDFETKSSYSARVRSTDGGGLSVDQILTITVTNVNEAPASVSLSNNTVLEGEAVGTAVGTFTATDPDAGDTHTFSLVAGEGDSDNGSFSIDGAELRTAEVFDQATQASYTIRVGGVDAGGLAVEQVFTITINEVNVAPTAIALSGLTVDENSDLETVIGTLSTTDANVTDTHTYTLVAGDGDADNGAFTVVGDELRTAAAIDFETRGSYSVRLQSTDLFGLSVEQVFAITVNDLNEAPTALALSNDTLAEDAAVGTVVGTLSSSDPDAGNSHTYSLVAGEGDADNGSFEIVGDELRIASGLDFETQAMHSIRVQSMDQDGLLFEQMFEIHVTDVNEQPSAIQLSNLAVDENADLDTVVGTLSTTDPDSSDTHTYTLVAGDGDVDNSAFTVVGDELRTAAAIDFETQGAYSVRLQSTDSFGLSVEQVFAISVNDLNEAPTALALSNDTLAEDAAVGTVVGTLSTSDADAGNTHTYSLVAGEGDADNGSFEVVGDELQVTAGLDFETQATYSIRVQSVDQDGLSFEQALAINVTDVNEQPTAISLSNLTVPEAQPAGTFVGTLAASDPDSGDAHSFSLVAGEGDSDNGSFIIDGDGLRTAEVFDQATKSSYTIRVESVDAGGLTVEQAFTITISEANAAPTAIDLSSLTVDENADLETVIGTLSTTDANVTDTHTYTLVAGDGDADNGAFTVVGDELRTAAAIDVETQGSYSVRVQSTDSFGLSVEQVFAITVNDLNEAPTALALSNDTLAEDAAVGTVVGTLSTSDPDAGNSHTYSLVAGEGDADNGSFELVGDELQTAAGLDFETQATYSIRVQSVDQDGLSFEQALAINVTDVNEQPTAISLSNLMVPEAQPAGTFVGTLVATDPDAGDAHTFSLVAGEGDSDNGSFSIDGTELRTAEVFDQATKSSYTIRVETVDAGGLAVEQAFTITISEANAAPTAIALSSLTVDENADLETVIGTLSTTDANVTDTHTYALVAGDGDADNGAFTVVGDELRTAAAIDFETQGSYSVRLQSTDSFGLSVEQVFVISVNDLNEAPTALALSNDTLAEDAAVGTVVGTLSTSDPDAGNTHTYSLVAGEGDADNGSFLIVGDELQTAAGLDFETQATYSIRVQSVDQDGLSFEQALAINVTDVNEQPTAISLSNLAVPEAQPAGTLVGTLAASDPDAGDAHTFSLVAGEGDSDNGSFTVVGDELRTAEAFDQATKSSYTIRVESVDAGGLAVEQAFAITISEANAAPTAIDLSSLTVDENADLETAVGTLSTTDANVTDTHTYTLVAGDGDADNGAFTVVGDELRTAAAIDFESQGSYSVRLQSTDSFGLSVEQVFAITVNDLNEAPTALALSNDTLTEDAAVGTVVGTLSTSDPDAGNTHTYSLVAGEGDADNGSFLIVGDELRIAVTPDFETQETYSIRVRSVDQDGEFFEQVIAVFISDVNE